MGAVGESTSIPHESSAPEELSCPTLHQNIQNEDPQTHLSHKIGQQFNKPITASKNIMQVQTKRHSNTPKTADNLPPLAEDTSSSAKPENSQQCDLAPVFEVLSRVKVKRPTFEMIQIDPKKFLKTKGKSIYADYDLTKEIGKGAFGSVFRAKELKTGAWRAVKKIPKQELTPEEKVLLANEFEILCKLDHPNIVKLYDIYDDAQNLYVVTELCEGGDLLHFVNSTRMTEPLMRTVMLQLLSALKYMHSFRILHRDIKLENIVLVKNAGGGQRINVKIIDFGISLALPTTPLPQDQEPQGTLLYMSPESLSNRVGLEADIWSCGIALYMMATRNLPYRYTSENELVHQIKRGKIDRNHLQKLSLDLKVFIMQLLEPNPEARCSASKAINSSWLKKQQQNSSLTVSTRVRAARNLLDYDAKNNLVSIIEGYLIYKRVGQEERQRLASIFQEIDLDNSGIIEIDELKKFYSENSEHYDAEQVEELLAVMDKNKSGKIDFNEFITAMCDRRILFQRQALEEAFDYFDRDKSGEISRQELEEILEGVLNEEIEYLFAQLDKNQDRKISRKEFMNYLSKYE